MNDGLEEWRKTPLFRWGNVFLLLHHLTIILAGVTFFVRPARTLVLSQLDVHTWGLLWSMMFLIFGGVGLYARLRKRWMSEGVAVIVVGASLVLWGCILIGGFGPEGLQTGLALIAGGWYRIGWAIVQFAWITQPPLVDRVITMVNEHLANGEDHGDEVTS